MADVNFYDVIAKDGLTPAERFAAMAKEDESFYTVGADLYIGAQKLTNGADLATVVANVAQNASDIVTINQTLTKLENDESTSGSIRNLIRSYLNTLNGGAGIASKTGKAITIASSVAEIAGVISATGTPITLADVASTGDAGDVIYSNSTSGLTATNVQAAIDEVANQSAGGVGSKTVYITETAGQSADPFSKRYGVYQGASGSSASPVAAEKLVDIDIPKDMVVESGSVGTVTTADVPYAGAQVGDKYIDLVIANASSDHIYIPANSLVDIYTAEQSASQIQLVIDNNNEISATIVAGSVTSTELAADAVITAKIADGNVTKVKLAQSVQDSLDLADSAVQSVAEGATAGTIAVDGTDVSVHGLASVATSGDSSDVAYDNTSSSLTATDVQGAVDELKDALDNIDVSGDIQDAIDALDGSATIATKSGNAVTIKAGVSEIDGVISNSSNADIVLADVAVSGSSADVSYVNGSILTVGGALDDLYAQIGQGGSVQAQIDAAIDALDTASDVGVASVANGVVTISGSVKEEDGIIAKGTASDVTLAKIATTGAAEDVALSDAGSHFTTDTVEAALQELATRLTWQEI